MRVSKIRAMTRQAFAAWMVVLATVFVWSAAPQAPVGVPQAVVLDAGPNLAPTPGPLATQAKPSLVQRATDERFGSAPDLDSLLPTSGAAAGLAPLAPWHGAATAAPATRAAIWPEPRAPPRA